MEPTCQAQTTVERSSRDVTYKCNREAGHPGNHEGWSIPTGFSFHQWAQEPLFYNYSPYRVPFIDRKPEEDTVTLKLTLEELKVIAYALSGPEWLEDEPELVKKIDKALKEAL
jgi:hypothetical protein